MHVFQEAAPSIGGYNHNVLDTLSVALELGYSHELSSCFVKRALVSSGGTGH